MESASVAFCYEALRHCYHILGKERFRAETEYIMKCFDIVKPVEVAKQNIEDLPVENKVIEIKKEHAKPILKKVKETQPIEIPKNEVVEVEAPKIESSKVEASKVEAPKADKTKWKRTQIPDEDRCKRILPYNGGQCTFKKMDGCNYCSRHGDKQ